MCVCYMQVLCHFIPAEGTEASTDIGICRGPGTDAPGYQGTAVLSNSSPSALDKHQVEIQTHSSHELLQQVQWDPGSGLF